MDGTPPVIEHVTGALLESVDARMDAERFRRHLLDAGLLRDVDAGTDPASPQAWIVAIRGLVFQLVEIEDRARAARRVPRWMRFSLPRLWWIGLPGLGFLGFLIAVILGDTYGERLQIIALEVRFALMVAFAGILWSVVQNVRERRALQEERRTVDAARSEVRGELLTGITALSGRSFLARIGPNRWLMHTPHLEWVQARLRDVRTNPGAAPAPLLTKLETAAAILSEARDAAATSPPEVWICLEETVDVSALARQWRAAGLGRPADEAARWAALGA